MRIPRSNFSIATTDRFAVSADMREPVSQPQEIQRPEQSASGAPAPVSQPQAEHVVTESEVAEIISVAPLSYAPAVVTEVTPAASTAAPVPVTPSYPLRSKQMSNNFAVKHWMDQDRSAKAEEQTAVAQPAIQEPAGAAVPAAPQAVSAPVHPKPANPTMTVPNPHVAYQGLSVREQFGSGEKVWKNAFALAENVRFTRTPENELQRLRAKLIEEFGAEEEVQPSAPAQKEVAAAPVIQPVAAAPVAAQPVRTAPVLRGPSSMIVAARLRLPVVPVAPHVEAAAPLAGIVPTPVVSIVPEAEVVNAVVSHLPEPQQPVLAEPVAPVAEAEQGGLQLSNLSDFAFWEFAGLPEIAPAAEVVVETVTEPAEMSAPVLAPVAVMPVAEAAAPVAEEKSILSMFRAVEWRPAHEEAQIAETVAEVVASAEPQAAIVAEAAVEIEAETPAPVAEAVTELAEPALTVSNPFLPSFSFGLSGYQMPVYSIATQALNMQPSLNAVSVPPAEEAVAVAAEPLAEMPVERVAETIAETVVEDCDLVQEAVAEQEEAHVAQTVAPVTFAAAPAPRNPSASINLSIFSPTAIETGTVMSGESYEYPPRALLQEPVYKDGAIISQEMLERSAGLLESILEDFGVRGEIIHVRPGPVVTLYEFEPAPGVKSSRVIGLADDIARSMSALSARVAVVPGRNVIGIELPNSIRETVYFRELIESPAFERTNCRLALCLGKTIGGEPVIAELAKMPHLLVAGTTGSGKSVAINTMILSLLYRLKPEECRLIMIDPKMLELSIYDGIPHLLTPVVTDPKKAVVALKWTVREMEERYRKMSRLGVRNIDGYNARAAAAREKGETVTCTVQAGFDKATGEILYEEQEMDLTPMPYIVVIVDEMADLMMVAGKEIEGAIQRLAQMARAAGIHLIMATQRPSVDVITGTIKANFPTRISFQVTSKIDSRTILGEQGAEQLLGQGDMLHMAGGGRIVRVHGPFVSDEEVEKVVNHLKEQGRPDYLATVTADEEDADTVEDDSAVFDKSDMASDDGDDLYEKAVKVVLRDKKCSTSYIQRRLSIGYNRAASLVERMEQEGLVGAANHVGKREIIGQNDGM
ncbi:DNA translocase FtsK [Ochrobactrum sp. SFR4]|uniref:DNA translocase FtsK n=1 Tax=Ochrobactrum sp. SFR4 TaxID=2717368 RepID=UPI002570CECF|nr:DNA translocase FtsK [Ochrobactrum sp. SFR4]